MKPQLMYVTTTGFNLSIKKVLIEKMTHKSVWIDGVKWDRVTKVKHYHVDLEDAKKHIKTTYDRRLKDAQEEHNRALELLNNI